MLKLALRKNPYYYQSMTNFREIGLGIETSNTDTVSSLPRIISKYETEIRFSPGSQEKTVITLDDLKLLLEAAKDGLLTKEFYDSLGPIEAMAEDIGYFDVSKSVGRLAMKYFDAHPEL